MDPVETAKQLQAERLEQERIAREQQEKAKQQADEKARLAGIEARTKTEQLLPLLMQFKGFKIANGHVTVDAEMKYQPDGCLACLKAGSIGSSALNVYPLGVVLAYAQYDPATGHYRLDWCQLEQRGRPTYRQVGTYTDTGKLMDAIAVEISKM
jgi:hypothetical protein